jgi:hypothetical protein
VEVVSQLFLFSEVAIELDQKERNLFHAFQIPVNDFDPF